MSRAAASVAVFSDVHANAEALDAVLEDIDRCGVTELWCLGDVIGNGHDPVGCLNRVEERCTIVLAGNHEVAIAGGRRDLPPAAEYSRQALLEAGRGRLESLVSRASEWSEHDVRLAHGCPTPFDPARSYLSEDVDPHAVLAACPESLILVGHTHVAGAWSAGGRQLVNVGSVGEPRDGGLPAWAEVTWGLDGTPVVHQHRVEFDVEHYRASMAAAHLPLPPMYDAQLIG